MSVETARYQFHSWARKGIANNITEGDDLGSGASATMERAQVPIGVTLNGEGLTKNFALIGPGDIIGVNRDMVVRTEPRNWITDYESNYLPLIEFYDEDFAWRYTPAAPSGTRLRPWIFLLVLREDEFERSNRRVPLPSINIKVKDVFPPINETWLWAHVHSNADIPESELSNYEKFLQSLNQTMSDDPDQVFCRIINPRKLEPNTAYSAFLIPAFETGRLAGLDQPTAGIRSQMASWDENGAKGEMPFYFDWSFRTGANVDFEELVRLLVPRPMDKRVGIRDMDCHQPGFVKASGVGELPGTSPAIIGLEGALKSPSTVSTVFPDPPAANEFQQELQEVANLPYEIIGKDDSGDPIVSIPIYGGNHAKKSAADIVKLDITRDTWVHDLNKDPRTRVAAGFGTRVVQKNQEDYMQKAWQQVTKVMEANKIIRHTLLYMKVSLQYTAKTFSKMPGNVLLAVSKPVLGKVMGSPTTLLHQIQQSRLPGAVFSGAFRRAVRPKGRLAKKIGASVPLDYDTVVTRLNNGEITAAPPKGKPAGMPNTDDIAGQLFPHRYPDWLLWLMRHSRLLLILALVLFFLVALLTGAWVLMAVLAAAAIAGYMASQKLRAALQAADELKDPALLAGSVANVPAQPNFTLQLSDLPGPLTPTPGPAAGGDSVEAANFRTAMGDFMKRIAIEVPQTPLLEFSLSNAQTKVGTAINPHISFPNKLSYYVKFPAYIDIRIPEKIFEAMAYPDFEDAMYKKLVDISEELLLPNLKLIPQNTISLLKTNQKFIESYMVGLNHEMGNELLWREFPTDRRGSYFRQFWEVKGVIRPKDNKKQEELTEEYKDIKPIHTWPVSSMLGRHNNRDAEGDAEQTVLLVRGDLLKRYPNTVIFAQKAIAGKDKEEPVIDTDLTNEEFEKQVKFPLYKAELPPDIKLFGFDLKIEQARGTELTPGFTDNLGWFFIIQEVPGEARFGMDIRYDAGSDGLSWDDLSWTHLPADTKFIKGSVLPTISLADKSKWGADSAHMADVLFQKPNMVAVHAKEMLETM
jgi:hypothetical protein